MSSAQAFSALPLFLAFLATVLWLRQLRTPIVFFIVAMLVGLGSKVVASYLWAAWQATSNQFFTAPAAQIPRLEVQATWFQAVATSVVVIPIYWFLSKRL